MMIKRSACPSTTAYAAETPGWEELKKNQKDALSANHLIGINHTLEKQNTKKYIISKWCRMAKAKYYLDDGVPCCSLCDTPLTETINEKSKIKCYICTQCNAVRLYA